jgi:hypothetical protein
MSYNRREQRVFAVSSGVGWFGFVSLLAVCGESVYYIAFHRPLDALVGIPLLCSIGLFLGGLWVMTANEKRHNRRLGHHCSQVPRPASYDRLEELRSTLNEISQDAEKRQRACDAEIAVCEAELARLKEQVEREES